MKNLIELLFYALKAQVNLALWARHGVGKTEGVNAFVEKRPPDFSRFRK